VVVAPHGGSQVAVLLARAVGEPQVARIGDRTGGRVGLFLYTDDLARDPAAYRAKGVVFVREPKAQPYGSLAVFRDLCGNLCGNLWNLLQPAEPPGTL